ncbi:proteasome ATPase [Mariniluteicoccus endophyticus]
MTNDAVDPRELQARVAALREEVSDLRGRVARHPGDIARLEKRLSEARQDARSVAAQNERLSRTLAEARTRLVDMKAQLDALGDPPLTFGIVEKVIAPSRPGETLQADVQAASRRVRTVVHSDIAVGHITAGSQVLVNDSMIVVHVLDRPEQGEVMVVKDLLADRRRALVVARSDDELVVRLADLLDPETVRPGDQLLVERKTGFAYEVVPKLDVEELVLEEVPDIDYGDIGGLTSQIGLIQDAVELPFLHGDLYRDYELAPPKGVLLYGPPGCGKTMIAKAVANSLARKVAETTEEEGRAYFLNVKGPELLNKYVGETERHIRQIFQRARAKASQGMPVIVFFDEMDSLFRTRGSGVSSDVETTIVPQLLSELDGVEGLANVIVIGASNREDMIDPAILRPGRLDVKIRIERPDAEAAREIFAKYLTPSLPLLDADLAEFDGSAERCRRAIVDAVVDHMYAAVRENEFLEVTYAGGDREVLYFKDFASGAMIRNIVDRAKKAAIKDRIAGGSGGMGIDLLLRACDDEFAENEDLPNTTNPDDWAKVSGRKGERIVNIRTIYTSKKATERVETASALGQYL